MPKRIAFIVIFITLLSGCATVPPENSGIWVAGISESLTRYYIPATTWQEEKNRLVTSRIDITYVDEPERPAVCNISFFNNTTPENIDRLFFTADGLTYPLDDVKIMFVRIERKEIRITSTMTIEKLLTIFQAEKITLNAAIDSIEYVFIPDREFIQFKNQFNELLSPYQTN